MMEAITIDLDTRSTITGAARGTGKPRRSPFRQSVRFNLPNGETSIQKLPKAGKVRLGHKCNVMLVYPKSAPGDRQHLIWFERVKGGWWPRGVE